MKSIPIKKRGEIAAYAKINDEDYESLAQWSWNLMENGYAVRGTNSRGRILMHREVMGLVRGDGLLVDHINQDKLDNRRDNLRLATWELNARNRGADKTSTSRHLGVSWCRTHRKWIASATLNRKRICVGYFNDELVAARAARSWREEHTPDVYFAEAIA